MKRMAAVFFVCFCCGQARAESVPVPWQEVFAARIKAIEASCGIAFDRGWEPRFVFAIPDEIPVQLRRAFGGQYVPETESFSLAPAEEEQIDPSLIDHELGHALADQVSRRAGNGMWPDIPRFAELDWEGQVGVNVISEGIGTYFQYQGKAPFANDEREGSNWLPEGVQDIAWQGRDYLYNGGRWIVAPIIRKFGERGIVYLVTHPLRFEDYRLRSAAVEYQRAALERLAEGRAK